MSKQILKNQNIPTKPCPRCKTGKVYTGERSKALNLVLDGVAVCEDCVVKDLVNKYHNKPVEQKASGICWGCGNNIGAGEDHWEDCYVLKGDVD